MHTKHVAHIIIDQHLINSVLGYLVRWTVCSICRAVSRGRYVARLAATRRSVACSAGGEGEARRLLCCLAGRGTRVWREALVWGGTTEPLVELYGLFEGAEWVGTVRWLVAAAPRFAFLVPASDKTLTPLGP